jgi:hypothetical protein
MVAAGNHLNTAAQAVGIGKSTLYQWLQLGRDAAIARDNGEPLTDHARAYVEFAESLARPRAEAEVHAVGIVEKVMAGGYLVSEQETIARDGTRTVKPAYAPADGKLALEYLAWMAPDRWGRNGVARVEVTGPESAPIEVEEATVAAALTARLSRVLAEREAERQAALQAGAAHENDETDAEDVDG